MQSKEVQERVFNTMVEKYNGFTLQSDELKEKVKQTCLHKYGVENPYSSKEVQEKIKNTFLDRYGIKNPMQSKEVQEKVKQTNIERYGSENVMQSFDIRKKSLSKERNMTEEELDLFFKSINSQEWWNNQESFLSVKTVLKDLLTLSQIYIYAHKFRPDWTFKSPISQPHQRVINLLNEHQIEYEINTRSIISPLELDIYIPSKSLAIEVNGIYWHSELSGKDRNYHLNKTIACEKKGIQLLQFWDIEIEDKWDIVSSMIINKLWLIKNKIGARKCIVKSISSQQAFEFFEKNHIQGGIKSAINYGLFLNKELISAISFSICRFDSNKILELTRFGVKNNTSVIGAFSKLFKHHKGDVVTYADRRYSIGNVYLKNNFTLEKSSNPGYKYLRENGLESRMKYQKHKLPNLLETFNPDLTEWENMKVNGFDRIWDCGNLVFKFNEKLILTKVNNE